MICNCGYLAEPPSKREIGIVMQNKMNKPWVAEAPEILSLSQAKLLEHT